MENKEKKSFQVLTLITTPKLADIASEIFLENLLPIHYRFNAQGTASSEIMDMLGLGSTDKCALVTVIAKEKSREILYNLQSQLRMHDVNSGIAFTLNLNGATNMILQLLMNSLTEADRKDEIIMSDTKHVLIATVVNRGYSSDVMEVARKMGAKGGTVIHSRAVESEETRGFWGTSVQEEKEIVIIISEIEQKVSIMQSISENCGMHSDAKGIVMSMPIDTVVGM